MAINKKTKNKHPFWQPLVFLFDREPKAHFLRHSIARAIVTSQTVSRADCAEGDILKLFKCRYVQHQNIPKNSWFPPRMTQFSLSTTTKFERSSFSPHFKHVNTPAIIFYVLSLRQVDTLENDEKPLIFL